MQKQATKKCSSCKGNGSVRGLGWIHETCDVCNGRGKVSLDGDTVAAPASAKKIDKRSASYKDAIKKIKATNADMTDDEAEALFEKEYDKLA